MCAESVSWFRRGACLLALFDLGNVRPTLHAAALVAFVDAAERVVLDELWSFLVGTGTRLLALAELHRVLHIRDAFRVASTNHEGHLGGILEDFARLHACLDFGGILLGLAEFVALHGHVVPPLHIYFEATSLLAQGKAQGVCLLVFGAVLSAGINGSRRPMRPLA